MVEEDEFVVADDDELVVVDDEQATEHIFDDSVEVLDVEVTEVEKEVVKEVLVGAESDGGVSIRKREITSIKIIAADIN